MTSVHYYPRIGSVSEGTLRTEDLLDTFAGELSYHMKRMRLTREQRKRFGQLLRDCREVLDTADNEGTPADDDTCCDIVDQLQDALDEIAPPYCYFGTSEGDGACFGFWPIIDEDLPKLEAGDPIDREHWGEDVLLVSDHGNVSCGHVDKRGKFRGYWSCV